MQSLAVTRNQRLKESKAMLTTQEATSICNEMWMDSEITDPELGATQVIRDLVRIAQNKTSPLAAVEAMEILVALDPESWQQYKPSIR